MPGQLDYDRMVMLDAEALAEGGIGQAYESLLPQLQQHVLNPAALEEILDDDAPSYMVKSVGQEHVIYSPEFDDEEVQSWGRAAFALFSIVNAQLANTAYRFYAINGGNDLGRMFLTAAEVEAAKLALPDKLDWPYLPENMHPWYGQPH